jgi:hypothetical protein
MLPLANKIASLVSMGLLDRAETELFKSKLTNE